MTLVFSVIIFALIFEYINGFHDTANSIATVVATKVLSPQQAVLLATCFNLIGALAGTAVATTIGKGLVDVGYVSPSTILCGLIAAIVWNLVTWFWGLPSSSSHAMIGGLVGSTVAVAHDWGVVKFFGENSHEGLVHKVIIPMFASPLMGFIASFIAMGALYVIFAKSKPHFVNYTFGKLQLLSSAWMGYSHGMNDAQKTMGIIALTLFTADQSGQLKSLPEFFNFMRPSSVNGVFEIDLWVKISCALTMAAGTWAGGWRIIRTLGHKIVTLKPIHGFAAETTSAVIIQIASNFGIPLSTTHVISSSILGVGAAKRINSVNWGIAKRMFYAWMCTIPICGLLGFALVKLFVN